MAIQAECQWEFGVLSSECQWEFGVLSTPEAHSALIDVSRWGLGLGPWVGWPHASPAFTLHSEKFC